MELGAIKNNTENVSKTQFKINIFKCIEYWSIRNAWWNERDR